MSPFFMVKIPGRYFSFFQSPERKVAKERGSKQEEYSSGSMIQ